MASESKREFQQKNLVKLHQLIVDHFNLEELQYLCFQVLVDYDELGEGLGKSLRVAKLITLLMRQGRLDALMQALEEARPQVTWPADLPLAQLEAAFRLPPEAPSTGLEIVDVRVIDDPTAIKAFRLAWFPKDEKVTGQHGDLIRRLQQATGEELLQDIPQNLLYMPKGGVFPVIDIKLLNRGDTTLFLKRLIFRYKLHDFVTFEMGVGATLLPVWEYHILFDVNKQEGEVELDISQVIKPQEADRFAVVVGLEGIDYFERIVFSTHLQLLYDAKAEADLGHHTITFLQGELPKGSWNRETSPPTFQREPLPLMRLDHNNFEP